MLYTPDYHNWLPLLISITVAWHALLYKRSPRAAAGWIAFIILVPYAGAIIYFVLGINRVHTRAKKLLNQHGLGLELVDSFKLIKDKKIPAKFTSLVKLADKISHNPLVGGNSVEVLHNGESAYPAMLSAIHSAKNTVYLSTYIFDVRGIGRTFIAALKAALQRGVTVKVIIDGIGELGSYPLASRVLREEGIPVGRFLPPRLLPPSIYMNLRNHRKALIVDGELAFIGGMNISERHLMAKDTNKSRVSDIQFKLTGRVATQIEHIFLEDWLFITGESISIPDYKDRDDGMAHCRAISDGPNEDIDCLLQIITCALVSARKSITIMTPYFIPPRTLIDTLNIAALRGVRVDVILPEKSDLRFVDWATRSMLWQLLERGVNIYYQAPPFAHTKYLVIDEQYCQIGSANFDPRSLRLNFELTAEIYDLELAKSLSTHFKMIKSASRKISLQEMDSRPLLLRTRDALVWLFSPYL